MAANHDTSLDWHGCMDVHGGQESRTFDVSDHNYICRNRFFADLIQFSVQYKGIENRLLKELAIPYAIALEDGRILWKNDCFLNLTEGQRKERYLNRMIPELHPGVFPKNDVDHVELEVTYRERSYQAELRKVSLEGFSEKEELLQIPEEQEYFNRTECLHPRERRSANDCRIDLY